MRFVSTRSPLQPASFEDAILKGLAPDGGLYVMADDVDMRDIFLTRGAEFSFVELAAAMMHRLVPDYFGEKECQRLCETAFGFAPQLRSVDDSLGILELFHGPSCAFKDFGASFLATLMQEFLSARKQKAIILTATSGDTGSAVAQAFHKKAGIDVVILYPSGRVSPSQEQQLTTVGDNVHALEVSGNFDDCQRLVKEAFNSEDLRCRFELTSANSINLGRLIPQSFYYAWAFLQSKHRLGPRENFFCVPSGNFGNLTAGVLAWRWGLPVTGFIAATNANDVVPSYIRNGFFEPKPSVATLSNAMDVGNPSNFERLQWIFQQDLQRMRALIHPEVVSDSETTETMKLWHKEKALFVCPHTAVGLRAAEAFSGKGLHGDGNIITLATAHPAKFNEVLRECLGTDAPMPDRLKDYMSRKKVSTIMEPKLELLQKYLEAHF